jgi:hypothetical protein
MGLEQRRRRPVVVVALATAGTMLWFALASPASPPARANLVHNGDFEVATDASPPPGWAMWGSEGSKVPANYARDMEDPHGGSACLRIHHPASTEGYLVTAPRDAIRPEPATRYRITFWARSRTPGVAVFLIEAYSSLDPCTGGETVGPFSFRVSSQWREFTFAVQEGQDFSASRSHYLMLGFQPTGDGQEEQTLWIDDVSAIAERPAPGSVLDESKVRYRPLQHRLRPGDSFAFTVDAQRVQGPATNAVGGISFHRLSDTDRIHPYNTRGEYVLSPEMERAITELHLPMTRLYEVGAEPYPVEAAIDKAAFLCDRVGISQEAVPLELEEAAAWEAPLSPEVWARAVAYSERKGYGFRLWEVGNEVYLRRSEVAFATPDDYARHVREVSRAIHAVSSKAKIGLSIDRWGTTWGTNMLGKAAGSYDFVAGHYYVGVDHVAQRRPEAAVLTGNFRIMDRALQIGALMKAYNPGRDVYQYDTEWGMSAAYPIADYPDYVDRNANMLGTLHRAVRLIYYAREGFLRGASSWCLLSESKAQGFGVLAPDAPDKRFMLYWLYYYFNRYLGVKVLAINGTAPYFVPSGDDPYAEPGEHPGPLTPAVVTLSQDGRTIYAMIANASWEKSFPCEMTIKHFRPRSATGVLLSNPDLDRKPMLESKEELMSEFTARAHVGGVDFVLPAHSVLFLKIERALGS